MARTKASVGAKVSAGKSSKARCCVAPTPSTSSGSGSERGHRGSTGGGNPVCPRETPKWQKPITNFFINKEGEKKYGVDLENDDQAAGSSHSKSPKNIIESDEDEILLEKPKNNALDESIDLEPLNGEDSHKIEEYYTKGSKGKGVGKKSKGKENRRESKREREDEEESVSKKVKVN
ncbi:unnamed protein product [Arctia plantaginis]|uniref:PCNA-associated factor n=1 Tax=Arctia plantaginis TaxID=874455 RepID=A0A8S1A1F5_ARCPL|nr:unnamed protein product [Arctia plantaginis]